MTVTPRGLPAFHASVDEIVELFETEPFGRYEDVIAIHRVDVVSSESGVDNDPVEGIDRDTELDMQYWCGGTERALCVNIGKAYSYAQNAPDVDQVVALANSSKYGGAAYPSSNISTSSADTYIFTPDIVKHELGHALGNLADEYSTGGPTDWPGGEPSAQNVSTLDADSMRAQGAKWADWLGSSRRASRTYEGELSRTGSTALQRLPADAIPPSPLTSWAPSSVKQIPLDDRVRERSRCGLHVRRRPRRDAVTLGGRRSRFAGRWTASPSRARPPAHWISRPWARPLCLHRDGDGRGRHALGPGPRLRADR